MPGYSTMRLPEAYRVLRSASPHDLAWEWLRRNAEFRAIWTSAGAAARRASEQADAVIVRSQRPNAEIPLHPLVNKWAAWGVSFAPNPDLSARNARLVAWSPTVDTSVFTVVQPVAWTRAVSGLDYSPSKWGERTIAIAALAGTHRMVLRHGLLALSLWEPDPIAPRTGKAFGLYLHADSAIATRLRSIETFRRAVIGTSIRARRTFAAADRHAVMLYVHDLGNAGLSIREIARELFGVLPEDWRSSSQRSDLRRLAETAGEWVNGGYRRLLGIHPSE